MIGKGVSAVAQSVARLTAMHDILGSNPDHGRDFSGKIARS